MTDTTRDLIQRLTDELQVWIDNAEFDIDPDEQALIDEAHAYLSQPEPSLTVENCSNMHKHAGNYIAEDFGEITLDGSFTREDLIEIANTVPTTEA